jgi:hypothetical protein
MTKPDVFAALMIAFGAAFVLAASKWGVKTAWKRILWLLPAGIVPVLGFFLYFLQFQDWWASIRSVAFAWVPVLGSSVSKEPFYKWCMGLDVPGFHIRAMLIQFGIVCAVVSICAIWFRRDINTSLRRLVTVGLVATLIALASNVDWVDCGRSLPLLVLALCIFLWVQHRLHINQQREPAEVCDLPPQKHFGSNDLSLAFPILWAVLSLGLLAKLGFYSRIWHYGFILAMPAFVASIYLLLWALPSALKHYGVRVSLFRSTIWLLLMTGFLRLFVQSQLVYRDKSVPVGQGHDVIIAFSEKTNPAGPALQSALEWMSKNVPEDATLAVLPEGAIVNYLARRHNPTRYLAWDPAQIAGFGQDNMTADFLSKSPDYIMLVHRDSFDYGVKFFGQQEKFGLKLMQWIEANYEPVCLIGNEPLRNSLFGIKILKRMAANQVK